MFTHNELREQYPKFRYKEYRLTIEDNQLKVQYFFEIPGLSEFSPYWKFPMAGHSLEELQENRTFQELIFSLGMVELVSYWKITCSPLVEIQCGYVTEEQAEWWRELYFHGLGEFYYTNGIEPNRDTFMKIVSLGTPFTGERQPLAHAQGCLVPIGGGKDSVVSVELMRKAGEECTCYIINPRGATTNTAVAGGFDQAHICNVKRTLDKNMIELNKQGYLNGHTPFSAIVAFSATITAYLLNLKYIVLSNEASANESTVKGSTVNHQYSKSFKFEQDFHTYEAEYVKTGTYYFSLLRPLSEFQIAKFFAECTPYHDSFRSCNVGSKEDIWCGHCAKCLFVYFILSPFIEQERLKEIFGADMLNDASMTEIMEQLVGVADEKPFECVGSRDEVNTAICLTIHALEAEGKELPLLFKQYKQLAQYKQYKDAANPFFTYYNEENLLPEAFAELVKKHCC